MISQSVSQPEQQCLLLGLRCYLQEGFRKVEFESDALLVIKTIEACNWHLSLEGHIFYEIKLIAAQLRRLVSRKFQDRAMK